MKAHRNAVNAFPLEGADAAASSRAAGQCNKTLGHASTADGERKHGALIRAAKDRGRGAWANFEVSEPFRIGRPSKATAVALQMLSWNMVGGKRGAKACLVATGRKGPDLMARPTGKSGCVSLRPSHVHVISLILPRECISGMRASRRMASIAKYIFAHLRNRIFRRPDGSGACGSYHVV